MRKRKIDPTAAAVWIDPRELQAWKFNPRVNEKAIQRVANSIKKFGFGAPIVARLDKEIIAGHVRWKAALLLELEIVPVRFMDLSSADAHLLCMADNRLGEIAGWDNQILLEQLSTFDIVDQDLAGWSQQDIAVIEKAIADEFGGNDTEEDEAPEPPANPITELGDIWSLGRHRLLCGDSTVKARIDELLDGASPFMMVTDPPYGIDYVGGRQNKNLREPIAGDKTPDLYDPAFGLSPCSIAYTWFNGANALPVYSAAVKYGFKPRILIIWNKLKARYAQPAAHYKGKHEPCLFSVKHTPDKFVADMSEPTVWDIEQPKRNEYHPTQKPVECMARAIRNHGGTMDEVYDPFAGSGTTLIASEQLNRRCYAVEIMPAYCDVIIERWENLSGEKAKRIRYKV